MTREFSIQYVALFFLPRSLPDGEILLAQVCIRLVDSSGVKSAGWGLTPLLPLNGADRARELRLRHCCEEMAEAWRGRSWTDHAALLAEQFRKDVLPDFARKFRERNGEDLEQEDIAVCLAPFVTALQEAFAGLLGVPEAWRPGEETPEA